MRRHRPEHTRVMHPEIRPDLRSRKRILFGVCGFLIFGFVPVAILGIVEFMIGSLRAAVILPTMLIAALGMFVSFLYALWPVLYFRCPNCQARIGWTRRRRVEPGMPAPRFLNRYCAACNIEWQTGWTESAGDGD